MKTHIGSDGGLMAVKWNTVKIVFRYCEGIDKANVKPYLPMIYDLAAYRTIGSFASNSKL